MYSERWPFGNVGRSFLLTIKIDVADQRSHGWLFLLRRNSKGQDIIGVCARDHGVVEFSPRVSDGQSPISLFFIFVLSFHASFESPAKEN